MSFSYNAAQLSSSLVYRARLELGDTLAPGVLQDEEIQFYVDQHGYDLGVAFCADACYSRVSQDPDRYKDMGGVEVEWTQQRVRHWAELAAKKRSGESSTTISSPGTVSVARRTIGPDMTPFRGG